MENLIIQNCTSIPPLPVKPKENYPFKHSNQNISYTKKTNYNVVTDIHLNNLCKNGKITEAISTLDSLALRGSMVKPITFINMLQYCIDLNDIELGRKLHQRIELVEGENPFVETKLISMYAKCGSLDDARKVFDEMRERNLYTWSAMIGACGRQGKWEEVVELFHMMVEDGVLPDQFLFPKILQACGNCGDLETGRLIHSLVVRCGMSDDLRVNNSVLAVYAKCGDMRLAMTFFGKMEERDAVSWNAVIGGYCQRGENDEAQRLFDRMCEEGIEPGLVTWNTLIAGYSQSGSYDIARDLMKKMQSVGIVPDVFTWTSMISGFSQNNRTSQALDLFRDMFLSDVQPNAVTMASAISACTSLKALSKGLELHSLAVKMGLEGEVLVGNSLIDLYAKCEELEAARQVFNMIKERDAYTWNSMIGGYCQTGLCGKAYELFMQMQRSNVSPNAVTWNAMISGHMKNGDEDEAMYLFQKMGKDGIVEPNTASWNSLIAGYVQNGQRDKALGVFRQMQSLSVNPNTVTVLSILPACGNLVAARMVKEIHACVLRRNFESELSVANSLIDTYSKSGNIEYSKATFHQISMKDIITWNALLAGYVLHGLSDAALELFSQMRMSGFRPNRGTFFSIISTYGLCGMVDEGIQTFWSITDDYQIIPATEHYAAMVNLYGRAGRLREAEEFIRDMTVEPESSVWTALLTASRVHGHVGPAVRAGERLLELEPGNFLIHRLLSQLHALYGKSEVATKFRKLEKEKGTRKFCGQSWIEVQKRVHTFVSGDRSNSQSEILHTWIKDEVGKVKYPISPVPLCMEEEKEEELGGFHSEKLAIAFALIGLSRVPQSIRIVKNARICEECHEFAKHISMTYRREIFISDSKGFHHFMDGRCSCGNYW